MIPSGFQGCTGEGREREREGERVEDLQSEKRASLMERRAD